MGSIDRKDRIRLVRQRSGLSQAAFGARIGVQRSAVSFLESGKNNPSAQTLKLICREFSVAYPWLQEGVGPMLVEQDQRDQAALDALMTSGHEKTKAFIKALARFSPEQLAALETVLEALGVVGDGEKP